MATAYWKAKRGFAPLTLDAGCTGPVIMANLAGRPMPERPWPDKKKIITASISSYLSMCQSIYLFSPVTIGTINLC